MAESSVAVPSLRKLASTPRNRPNQVRAKNTVLPGTSHVYSLQAHCTSKRHHFGSLCKIHMLPSLRKWMHSLWRRLKSAGSLFDFATPLIHYYYALPRLSKATIRIESVRDVSPLYKAFSKEDDEEGNLIFLYSSFGFTSDDFSAYFG